MALLAACTNTSSLPEAPPVPLPVRGENLPPYYLRVGDTVEIRLMLNPELNEKVTIRPDGHISTTVIADEVAAGRTPLELAQALTRDYSKDIQKPRLTVLVDSFASNHVFVGGEVVAPGELLSPGVPLSLSQALSRAGGLRAGGDDGNIFVIRREGSGPAAFFKVRYADVMRARDPAADIILAPYDVVYVPKTGIAEVYAFYNQYIEQFAHPSFGFNYVVGGGGGGNTGAVFTNPTTGTTGVVTTPTNPNTPR